MASLNLSVETDAAGVEGMWGLPPVWLPKLRALCGDPSDNIPGLPGVGPKRALAMIREGKETWPLPGWLLRNSKAREMVAVWHSIMELADPFRPPEPEAELGLFGNLDVSAAWSPESAVKVPELLDRYGMHTLASRLGKGTLW
jgi:5'-3' exonuclease